MAFQAADLRDLDPPAADLVLLVDVLHFLPHASQDALLRRLGRALPPGARMLIREVDASSGAAYRKAALREIASLLLPGRPHHVVHYRRVEDLRNALAAAGFEARDRSTRTTAARGRVLLEAVRRPTLAPRGDAS